MKNTTVDNDSEEAAKDLIDKKTEEIKDDN